MPPCTCIPYSEARELACALVAVLAPLNEWRDEAVAVQRGVEVGAVAAHVANQVAHARAHAGVGVGQEPACAGRGGGG